MRGILSSLDESIPSPEISLRYENPYHLLVATILSAQCTDDCVNTVTPRLFKKYPGARELASADRAALEEIIRPTGFFKNKAKSLIGCARGLSDYFSGQIPDTMEELLRLPGVGRKTANVILGACFGKPSVVVDTHVARVSRRLGLTAADSPDKIETDLMRLIPMARWSRASLQLLLHGRHVCKAKKPNCSTCTVRGYCPSVGG